MVTEATLSMDAYVASDNYGPVLIPGQTIAAGANLVKGTIVGRITASGKLVAAAATNTDDGSRKAVGVLMEDAAAASADVEAVVGFAGVYVGANMTGLTAAYKLALEAKGIYFV